MSAAVHAEPRAQVAPPSAEQIPLLAPAPLGLLEVSVWGRLTKHAEIRIGTDNSTQLVVVIHQRGEHLPFVAVRHAPEDKLAVMQELAARMPPGTAVLIRCRGMQLGSHENRQVLKPVICDEICPAQFIIERDEEPS